MEIRLAHGDDAAGIASVHVHSWRAAYRGIVPAAYLESLSVSKREVFFSSMIAKGAPELWVAGQQSQVVGWVSFGASRDSDALVTTGELEAIYVAPTHWGTGLGRALWQKALGRLINRGFEKITLWVLKDNVRAIRFYELAGLVPNTEKELIIGGKSFREVRYERAIG